MPRKVIVVPAVPVLGRVGLAVGIGVATGIVVAIGGLVGVGEHSGPNVGCCA